MTPDLAAVLSDVRLADPGAVATRLRDRPRHPGLRAGERVLVVAADHPARGALGVGGRPGAMADRRELLERVATALARPGVTGFLGTADLVEDLALMGALDHRLVLGSMNRGGLAGSVFEVDDRYTGYDAAGIAAAGLDGGKLLLRVDPDDPASAAALERAARAVDELAVRGLHALVEPFLVHRRDGSLRTDTSATAVVRSAVVAAGLGRTSAFTWLKLPLTDDLERVAAATTLPVMLLGGDAPADLDATLARWAAAMTLPTVRGLVVGRSLLFPPGDDVAAAVDAAVAAVGTGPRPHEEDR